MGRRQYAEAMVIAGAVYQDIKDTSQNVTYVRLNQTYHIIASFAFS